MSKLGEIVLIATLGRSPPVITETVDILIEKGLQIRRVHAISTSDEDIWNIGIKLLDKEFKTHYSGRIEFIPHSLKKDDIYDERDNIDFLIVVGSIAKMERARGSDLYFSLAGGRKTMSAAMTLVAQVYGGRALTHVIVAPDLEKKGSLENLDRLLKEGEENEVKEILHPREKRLIQFPVIGISWMYNEVLQILKGKGIETKKMKGDVVSIMRSNGLIDDKNKPTELGRNFLQILEDVESFPPPSLKHPGEKLSISHEQHLPKNALSFVSKLARDPFVEKISDIEFRSSAETRMLDTDSEGRIRLQYSDGQKAVVLSIITTAITEAQAKKIAERLL